MAYKPASDEIYLSYWSWNMLKNCPRQFKLRVIDKPDLGVRDTGNAIQGSIPHAQAENFFKTKPQERDLNYFIESFESEWAKFLKENHVDWRFQARRYAKKRSIMVPDNDIEWAQALKKVETKQCSINLMRLIAQQGWERSEASAEETFRVVVEPARTGVPALTIGGRIDLTLLGSGYVDIWDVKAVERPNNLDHDQLGVYTMAKRGQGVTVRNTGYILLMKAQLLPKPVTPADEMDLRQRMREAARFIAAKHFPANYVEWRCGFCEVKHLCSEYMLRQERDQTLAPPPPVVLDPSHAATVATISSSDLDELLKF